MNQKERRPDRIVLILSIAVIIVIACLAGALLFGMSAGKETSGQLLPEKKQEDEQTMDSTLEGEPASESDGEEDQDAPEDETEKTVLHTYEIIIDDVSWTDAYRACEDKGGHLAVITSEQEFEEVVAQVQQMQTANPDLYYVWLGGVLTSSEDSWGEDNWITGESGAINHWYPGEPSYSDEDGTPEFYLCLWRAKYQEEDIGWTVNDQRNDILSVLPDAKGKIGYVCEYEIE